MQYADGSRTYGMVDALTYEYTSGSPSLLASVTETEEEEKGFKVTTALYSYDGSGNMTYASNKSLSITYSYHDMPLQMNTPNGKVQNYYTSSGMKIKSVLLPNNMTLSNGPTITNYFDNIEYENSKVKAVYFDEGRAVTAEEGDYIEYFLKDHLANTRVRIADKDQNNKVHYNINDPANDEVMSSHHYYPFGMEWDLPSFDINGNSLASAGNDTEYTYNGKEFIDDLDIGLFNYGARQYDPAIARWTSIDPLAEKYVHLSGFNYVSNNPINAIDPDGARILFVNGYWNSWIGGIIGSGSPGKSYWGRGFTSAAQRHFNDYSKVSDRNYIDGSSMFGGDQSGGDRVKSGYEYARKNYSSLVEGLQEGETFKLVTHSEGAAYGAGIASYLMERGHTVENILNLSPDEPDEFSSPENITTYQLDYDGDWVTGNKGSVSGTELYGVVDKFSSKSKQRKYAHGSTKVAGVFKDVKALLQSAATNAIGIKVNTTENGVKFTFIRDNRKE